MKNFIFGLILVLLSLVTYSQDKVSDNGHNVIYYDNGKIASEGNLENGKPNGYWKTYYESGIIKSEGNRVNFLLDGEWKFYDETGNLKLIITYKEGKKDGIRKTINLDNYVIENLSKDIKQGYSKTFDNKQRLLKEVYFINGNEEGFAKEFDTTGLVRALSQYKAGFLVYEEYINRSDVKGRKQGGWKWFNKDGNVFKEVTYKNDLMDGYYKEYDEEGNLIKILKYINGVQQTNVPELTKLDVKRDYYRSGNVKTIASYKEGVPEGVRREFSEEGKIVKSYIYEDGIIVGEGIVDAEGRKEGDWKENYKDGSIKAIGKYINGNKIGEWKYYHVNGKIEQEGKYYPAGMSDGTWKWYYNNGNLEREEEFIRGKESGKYIEYNDSTKVIVEGQYEDGDKVGIWKYDLDNYKLNGSYKEGLKTGEWKGIFNNGKTAFEGNYIEDMPDGKHSYYYYNGMIRRQGWYEKGKKEGEWKIFKEDGTLFITIIYKKGLEQSFDGKKIIPELDKDDKEIIDN